MSLPSFPQRGQNTVQVLAIPDDAPKVLKDWITKIQFTGGMVRWFGLIKPYIDEVRDEMHLGLLQLLGQSQQDSSAAATMRQLLGQYAQDAHTGDAFIRGGTQALIEDPIRAFIRTPPAVPAVIQDTRAHRASYPASQFDNALYVETDTTLVYRSYAGAWAYAWGEYQSTLAGILTGLDATDTGLRQFVSDYTHQLVWGGAAWGPKWGPDNPMTSGLYMLFEVAPNGDGANAWQVCDGSTVARLNPDGTTSNITLDDVTTSAYMKGGITNQPVAAASGTTTSHTHAVTSPTGTPSATTTVDNNGVGSTVAVGSATHTHTITNPTGGNTAGPGTLELRNLQKILYYRR